MNAWLYSYDYCYVFDWLLQQVANELKKIGLIVINVNIHDISDESGFIKALGQKAASEAINQAKYI